MAVEMTFGEILADLRYAHNRISQEELAKKTGIKRSSISNYERNLSFPTVSKLVVLAQFFDVSIDYLLGLSSTKTPLVKLDEIILSSDKKHVTLGNLCDKIASLTPDDVARIIDMIDITIKARQKS